MNNSTLAAPILDPPSTANEPLYHGRLNRLYGRLGVTPSRRITKARTSGHMAGLGTAARGANLYSSLFRYRSESASIIAPGREGSQSGGADAYLGARLFCKIGVCYSSCTTLEIEQ